MNLKRFVRCIKKLIYLFGCKQDQKQLMIITSTKLKKVGLHRISFGVEHGNEDFRKEFWTEDGKIKDIIEKLKIPKKLDIQFSTNNITDFQLRRKN